MEQTISSGSTVIGVFDNQQDANDAIDDLCAVGFDKANIEVSAQVSHESHEIHTAVTTDAAEKTAAVGAAVGLGTGTLWGLGIAAGVLPAVGPALLGGSFGMLASNAAVGAAAAGLGGALIGLGVSDNEADLVEDDEELCRTVVTVKAEDRADTACAILSRHQ